MAETKSKNTALSQNELLTISLREFASTIHGKFTAHISGEPEDQLRNPFETLITSIGSALSLDIRAVGETLLDNRLGRPDFAITAKHIPCGYVELKAPGKGADPSKFKGHDKNQWERFKNLPNLLYSDGIEWALFRNGLLIRKSQLSGNPCHLGSKAVEIGDAKELLPVFVDFLNWEPIVPNTAKQLAFYLAPLCRMLKNDVADALKRNNSAMQSVARDWRNYLFPDADNEKFADSYAQTVTFALLLARSNGADTLFLNEAVSSLTSKNTLLGRALHVLTDDEVREDVKASLDMLKRVIQAIPTSTMSKGRRDPWLHFYEDFLQEYDPKLRKDAGAYYTPLDVVQAQTALVDDILRNKMDKPMGFAEGGVTTLDPAVGTGTYLLSIIDHAMKHVAEAEGDGAIKARASLLAQSLFGFEIMVGPYAVAALRMTRLLQDFGGGIPGDGVQIFLNNTLESPHEIMPELPMMYRAIGLEHQRAKRVKESVPVLVCIGNPPYDRHEAANSSNKMSTGAWVRWGEMKNGDGAILNDFIEPVKRAGKGGRLPGLYNLYVYFWRWALWKVFEQPFGQSGGIVSFITASSFVSGDAFLGMRQKMRELCDEIWIIDLGGDGRGTQQDDNVFAIQTPVAITIAVRYKNAQPGIAATVHHTRVEGSKAEKLKKLSTITKLSDLNFDLCGSDWQAPFLPSHASSQYFEFPKLSDLMPWQQSGCKFERSWPIACTGSILEQRWTELLSSSDRATALKENRDRKITSKTNDILSGQKLTPIEELETDEPIPNLSRYGFRSFDRQFSIADNRVGSYLRPALWKTHSNHQWYLVSPSDEVITFGPAMTVSIDVPDLHYFNGRGAKDIIPLFRDVDGFEPNLHPDLLVILEQKLKLDVTPVDWVCYIYGVMAHAGFSETFRSELSSRDVRVPISVIPSLFKKAIELGKTLLYFHSFGLRFTNDFPRLTGNVKCRRAVSMSSPVTNFSFDEEQKSLIIGNGEFGPVTPEIWNFEVSGLKVLQSWLGYRMAKRSGKKSSPLDDIGLSTWTSELTTELLKLIWILEKSLTIYPDQMQLLQEIIASDMLSCDDLGSIAKIYREPPKFSDEQAQLDLHQF